MVSTSVDINKIIASLVTDVAKDLYAGAKKLSKKKIDQIKVDFESCFTRYLSESYETCSFTKTLVYRDRPVPLKDIYVTTNFQKPEVTVPSNLILSSVVADRKSLIIGTAGAGKSMLMRKLFLDFIDERVGYIPILIELRYVVNDESITNLLVNHINEIIKIYDLEHSMEQTKYALEKGKFAILLDGLDEVKPSQRDVIEREIHNISLTYSNCICVVTSRPDESILFWDGFFVLTACPLNLEQAKELIGKLDFDEELINKFSIQIEDDLFSKYTEFLSNPLLLTIMLLTFEDMAEVPSKIHVYFEHAFSALFFKHDSTKQVFKRHSHSSLSIDEF